MQTQIRDAFERLNAELHKLEFTRDIYHEREGSIIRALDWIRWQQNPDGSWGLGSMIDIVLALQACGIWQPTQHEWDIKGGHKGGVTLAFQWLGKSQSQKTWDNNIWDTAAVVEAACMLDQQDQPCIQKATQWLIARSEDRWGLDQGLGLQYPARALNALVMYGAPREEIKKCREAIIDSLGDAGTNGYLSTYVAGQVVESLIASGVNPADEMLSPYIKQLKEYLIQADVSISNFMHICAAFKGLGVALGVGNFDEPALHHTLGKMFQPTRLREDGSWYRDITMTGWALVSLRSLKRVTKIEVYPYQIYSLVSRTQREIEEYASKQTRIRRRVILDAVAAILLLIVIGGMLASTVFKWPPGLNESLLYFFIGLLVTLAGYFIKHLIAQIR